MKFARLLASGRSLVNGNVAGRYQMQKGMSLPQFISPKNPFKQEAVASPTAPPSGAAAPATVSIVAPETEPAVKMEVAKLPSIAAPKYSWQQRTAETLRKAALFCLDHNPFSAIGKPQLPGIPRFGRENVQGELSLDKVKVVRSDLTHADLEVVPVGAGPK